MTHGHVWLPNVNGYRYQSFDDALKSSLRQAPDVILNVKSVIWKTNGIRHVIADTVALFCPTLQSIHVTNH